MRNPTRDAFEETAKGVENMRGTELPQYDRLSHDADVGAIIVPLNLGLVGGGQTNIRSRDFDMPWDWRAPQQGR